MTSGGGEPKDQVRLHSIPVCSCLLLCVLCDTAHRSQGSGHRALVVTARVMWCR